MSAKINGFLASAGFSTCTLPSSSVFISFVNAHVLKVSNNGMAGRRSQSLFRQNKASSLSWAMPLFRTLLVSLFSIHCCGIDGRRFITLLWAPCYFNSVRNWPPLQAVPGSETFVSGVGICTGSQVLSGCPTSSNLSNHIPRTKSFKTTKYIDLSCCRGTSVSNCNSVSLTVSLFIITVIWACSCLYCWCHYHRSLNFFVSRLNNPVKVLHWLCPSALLL